MAKRIKRPSISNTQSLERKISVSISPKANQLLQEMATKQGLTKAVVLEKLVQDSLAIAPPEVSQEPSPVTQEVDNSQLPQTIEQVELIQQLKQNLAEYTRVNQALEAELTQKNAIIDSLTLETHNHSATLEDLQGKIQTHQETESQLHQTIGDLEAKIQT
ncbi:hypothetical protein, partial [Gloeocapsa sp. PCC 73106]|uniref:hypothetical protein n=1 Tax=Gloeocapsa sp. PCC 73106 TaxID=102232 RepID=UPI0002AC0FDB